MGPPHRPSPPSSSTPAATTAAVPPPGTQTPPGPSLGMTPAARYEHNLKVLRRRDPSIVSIFDQFSYVCLYHHEDGKWTKQGFEGSMFLYERNAYPPYGFYIMNRAGKEDTIQRIWPEDDVLEHNNILIIRSYPDFLTNRMTNIRAQNLPPQIIQDKFSDIYAIPNIDEIDKSVKGRMVCIGLWMHHTTQRESMTSTMRKLHSYIRKNEPYPEEFRYGPGRPPPPNRLRAVTRKPGGSISDTQANPNPSDSENDQQYHSDAPSSFTSGNMSEVDKLFLRLQPASVTSTPAPDPLQQSISGISLLNDIFASAAPTSFTSSTPAPVAPTPPPKIDTPSSKTPKKSKSSSSHLQPHVHAPQPFSGNAAPQGPQILNAHVLTTILTGSAPSRAPSAASAVSHPSSREGDNEEDSFGENSDTPSTILDEEEEELIQQQHLHQPPSHNTQVPYVPEPPRLPAVSAGQFLAKQTGADLLSALGFGGPKLGGGAKVNGDVTPRSPVNGLSLSRTPSSIESVASVSTARGSASGSSQPAPEHQKPRANRDLVPFEPDSELWPYSARSAKPISSRTPTSASALKSNTNNPISPTAGDDDDIVELNFEDTSVLSDPDAFTKVLKQRRSAVSLKSQVNATTNGHSHAFTNSPSANGHAHSHTHAHGPARSAASQTHQLPQYTKGHGYTSSSGSIDLNAAGLAEQIKTKSSRRRSRREREIKAREEIEQSWDSPAVAVPGHTIPSQHPTHSHSVNSVTNAHPVSTHPATTTSPPPNPHKPSVPAQMEMLFAAARAAQSDTASSGASGSEYASEYEYENGHDNGNGNGYGDGSVEAPRAPEMKTPTMGARRTLAPHTNAQAHHNTNGHPTAPAKGKGKVSNGVGHEYAHGHGHAKVNGAVSPQTGKVDAELVKQSLAHVVSGLPKPPSQFLDKNEFMSEVVMLIHTDKSFAEKLYREYIARLA